MSKKFKVKSLSSSQLNRHPLVSLPFAHAEHDKFRYLKGADRVTPYESSPGNLRGFCRICGSSVPVQQRTRPSVPIPAGTLDDESSIRPILHIFTGSKAPWWEIDDELPKFEESVPGHEPESAG